LEEKGIKEMCRKKIVSIIIPFYNEGEVIRDFVIQLFAVIEDLAFTCEVIFINDGSDDDSEEIVKSCRSDHPELKIVSFTRNFGHQYALWAGIEAAEGDAIIMMDADLQHPPSLIPTLIERWLNGSMVVQTVRKDKHVLLFKKMTSKIFYILLNMISSYKFIPSSADFRLIDRRVVNELLRLQESDIFLRGLIFWLGFETSFVEFDVEKRGAGKSKYSFPKMIRFAVSGVVSFSLLPLRITAIFGLIISVLSFFVAIDSVYAKLFLSDLSPGWTSLMVGVFFIGGLSMIFLGIIGEYLGRIVLEVKNRPKFVIKESVGFEAKDIDLKCNE
jgi:dolichol-phosphate mannosyltransferase